MLRVTFEQAKSDLHPFERSTATFASFELATAAVLAYFNEHKDRYPCETVTMAITGQGSWPKAKTFPTSRLEVRLPKASLDVTRLGKTCELRLSHGKTTVNGNVHITEYLTTHTVIISVPPLVSKHDEWTRQEVLSKYGHIHHCGNPYCGHDCGMLRCGCDYTCTCKDDCPY
jgi:hypothetical protein